MNESIVEAGTIECHCGLKALVGDAGQITMPTFITDNVPDAQGRALSVDRNGTGDEGWVYSLVVEDARIRRVNRTTSILLAGTITIREAIHVRRNSEGQMERLERIEF